MGQLWHAWQAWHHHADFLLWGHQLWWWGRWGKVGELLGALYILIEIVTPERIKKYADGLPKTLQQWESKFEGFMSAGAILVITVVAACGAVLYACWDWRLGQWHFGWPFPDIVRSVSSIPVVVAYAGVDVLLKFAKLWVALGMLRSLIIIFEAVGMAVLGMVVWFLARPNLKRGAQIASVILLVGGFFFDMLAS
jgi:hypothetical protein